MNSITSPDRQSTVSIDINGAWLESYTHAGEPILFPKQALPNQHGDVKLRGGCHVCLPNFGPGGDSGQPQHGFGREQAWDVIKTDADMIEFELVQREGKYKGLVSNLAYQLGDAALTMQLTIQNSSDSPLRVAPAFHPYFEVPNGEAASIDGEPVDLAHISEAKTLSLTPKTISFGERKLGLSAHNLESWVLWSDMLGQYVCVEPTFAGASFTKRTPADNEMLKPGETSSYSLTITVEE